MFQSIPLSKIKPLAGYVLVEPAEKQTKTASGIYLGESNSEKPQHGTVVACGETALIEGQKVECPAKKGDQVIYKKWGGTEFKIEDVEYQFLKFEDLLAVIK